MSYTIASLDDIHSGVTYDYGKCGNKYQVGIYEKETKKYTHREFNAGSAAQEIYSKLTVCVIRGEYSLEDRINMLMEQEDF